MPSPLRSIMFVWHHPLNKRSRVSALWRYVRWQIASRVFEYPIAVDFVNDSRLLVRSGMTGATGNIYGGLHEFAEMGFLIHFLRKEDLFVDVGANVGTYTVLASAVVGARTIAVEPVPSTYQALMDNVHLNRIESKVSAFNIGLGNAKTEAYVSTTFDTRNRVVLRPDRNESVLRVSMEKLDDLLEEEVCPVCIKIDVEGYETEVVSGAAKTLQRPELRAVIMETNRRGESFGFDESNLQRRMIEEFGFVRCEYEPLERRLSSPISGRAHPPENAIYVRNLETIRKRVSEANAVSVLGTKL